MEKTVNFPSSHVSFQGIYYISRMVIYWWCISWLKLGGKYQTKQEYKPTTSQGLGVFLFGSSTLVFACRKVVTQNLRKEGGNARLYIDALGQDLWRWKKPSTR